MASTINAKNTSTGVVITPDASGQLELQTADVTRLTIDSSGNVIQASGNYFISNGSGFGWGDLTTYVGGTSVSDFINFTTNGSERMRIDSSGNVGIGTSSPTSALVVSGTISGSPTVNGVHLGTLSGYAAIELCGTSGTGSVVDFTKSGSDNLGRILYDNTNNYMAINTNSLERMRIDSAGNVGIGTSSPAQKLGVNGNIAWGTTGNGRIFSDSNWGCIFQASQASPAVADFMWQNGSGTERMRIDGSGNLLFNSGYGSVATAYGCRAWVNFNGTGTVAIRASGNVSSITDNGVGIYTINFTNAMPDVNYAVCASGRYQTAGGSDDAPIVGVTGANFSTPTTSAVQIGVTTDTAAGVDPNAVYVSVFR